MPFEQSRRAEDQRAGADRSEIARARREAAELAHEGFVVGGFGRGVAAGDEQQVAALDLGHAAGSGEDQAAVGFDRPAGLGGDDDARAGNAREDGVRPGEIELRHAGIDGFDNEEFGFGHRGAPAV